MKVGSNCSAMQELMSPFIDSMVTREETERLQAHLVDCPPCQRQLQSFISLRNLVARTAPVAPPEDLALETRVRLSHERNRNYVTQLEMRLKNVLRPLAIPALMGVSLTMLFFGILFGSIVSNTTVMAQDDMSVYHALYRPVRTTNPTMIRFAVSDSRSLSEPLMIETDVGDDGRVLDYRIIAGAHSPDVERWVKELLSLAEFTPAMAFGRPITSTIILSFVAVRS